MKLTTATSLLVSAALVALSSISEVDAHSWLTKPVARERAPEVDYDGSKGCPIMTPGQSTSYKAGETIDVRYWRNNHLGGFIRWSIAPKGQETKANLDKNAFYYTCRESGPTCLPKNANSKWAGDGTAEDNMLSCGDKITLPDWLPVGDYVLQWTWFGVGSDSGNVGWANPQFRSCADIKLTTKGTKSAAPKCPTFVGGDRVTKLENQGNNKCWYYYTNDIVKTVYKGSNEKNAYEPLYKFGIPAPIEKCASNSPSEVGGEATTAPAPATTTSKAPGTAAPGSKSPAPSHSTRPHPSTIRTPKPNNATVAPGAPTKVPDCKVKAKNVRN